MITGELKNKIDGLWDISENHQVKIVIEDESEDELEEYEDIDAEDELLEVLNTTTPMELIAMANYEFPEYKQTTALDLCLKELTRKNRITVAK